MSLPRPVSQAAPIPDDRRDPTRQRRRAGGRRLTDLTDPENPSYLRVSAVAAYFCVDRRVIEKWDELGFMHIYRFPGADRVALADIVAFIETHEPKHAKPTKRSG